MRTIEKGDTLKNKSLDVDFEVLFVGDDHGIAKGTNGKEMAFHIERLLNDARWEVHKPVLDIGTHYFVVGIEDPYDDEIESKFFVEELTGGLEDVLDTVKAHSAFYTAGLILNPNGTWFFLNKQGNEIPWE